MNAVCTGRRAMRQHDGHDAERGKMCGQVSVARASRQLSFCERTARTP
jgi:hypothetical protein